MMINYESSTNEKGNLTENQLRFNLEYEKAVFYPGMCFGEWGIIYNMKRTASSYCLEDTDVFYLTKEHLNEITNMENIIKNLENEQSDIYEFLISKYTELKKALSKVLKGKFQETKFVKK